MSWARRTGRFSSLHRKITPETILRVVYLIVAVGHLVLGTFILIGGKARFPYPTYQPLLDLSNHSVVPWGVLFLLSGALMLLPRCSAQLAGLALGFFAMAMFSAMFMVAFVEYPAAGSSAPVPYALIACIHVALMTLKVSELVRSRRG